MSAAAPAADPAETVRNPFVGPRAYGRDDRLYGRDAETEDLLDLLVAERVVLLYSPSGAGKTSLVQARLVPRLEDDGFRVLPIVRTTHEVPALQTEGPPPNRFVLSTLLSLEEGLPAPEQRPISELAGLAIARYLTEAPRHADAPENAVLIFDQFEEVLTTSPADREAKTEFFTQVGVALRNRNLWALFVIREDFLAELDPYARLIPTRFANRYRLDLLEAPAALDAVTLSSRDSGVTFQPDAAKKLVDDLRRIRVQHLGTVSEEHGPYVEPVQLQVVCRQLWERLGPEARTIEEADVEGVGDVDQALATYYAESMVATAEATGTDEAALRDWVDRELITAQGFRAQTLYGPRHDAGPDDAVLGAMIGTHLLRSESRRGAVWYELAHDRLVEPIRDDNERWRAEHLSDLDRRAALWDEQGRSDDLLFTGAALAEAEAELTGSRAPSRAQIHDFLKMSRHKEGMERARRRLHRRLVVALVVCLGLLVGVACLGWFFYQQQKHANAAALLGRASAVAERNPDLALALAVKAVDVLGDDEVDEQAQDQIQSLLDTNRTLLPLGTNRPYPVTAEFSKDGQLMVMGDQNGIVRVWDRDRRPVGILEAGRGLRSVDFGPVGTDGPAVVASSADQISVWSSPTDTTPTRIPSSDARSVALSPDGRLVVSGNADGRVVVFDVEKQSVIALMGRGGAGICTVEPDPVRTPNLALGHTPADEIVRTSQADTAVVDIGWTPDGTRIVAIYTDGHLVLWDSGKRDVKEPTPPLCDIKAHTRGYALDIADDGRTVATAGDSRAVIWDLTTGTQVRDVPTHAGFARDVDLSREGTRLLVADSDGYLLPYDAGTGTALYSSPDYGPGRIAARLDPLDPERALVVSDDSPAAVVDVSAGHRLTPEALDVTPDGTVVTAARDDGTVRLWSRDGRLAAALNTGSIGIADLALSADGRFMAILDTSGRASVCALHEGAAPVSVAENATAVAISRNGRFVATADTSSTFTVTDTKTGKVFRKEHFQKGARITDLVFGDTGVAVAAVYSNGTAAWWRNRYDRLTNVSLTGVAQFDFPYRIAWKGDAIATVGPGTDAEVWDARTGKRRYLLHDHTRQVSGIAFDRDGHRLATVGDDRDVVIWNLTTGERSARRTLSSWGRRVAFSPDGSRVYVIGQRGSPFVGYLERQELLDAARDHAVRDISPDECRRYVSPADTCPDG